MTQLFDIVSETYKTIMKRNHQSGQQLFENPKNVICLTIVHILTNPSLYFGLWILTNFHISNETFLRNKKGWPYCFFRNYRLYEPFHFESGRLRIDIHDNIEIDDKE